VSITPKTTFCIFKIWLAKGAPTDRTQYRLPSISGDVIYRSNAECMLKSNTA
jgi:hypothetical protein